MLTFFLILILNLLFVSQNLNSQEHSVQYLEGRTGPVIKSIYCLKDDASLSTTQQSLIVRPMLILNGVPIRDSIIVNCFRNYCNKENITKIRGFPQIFGQLMGLSYTPKDGIIFVNTESNVLFFSPSSLSVNEKEYFIDKYHIPINYNCAFDGIARVVLCQRINKLYNKHIATCYNAFHDTNDNSSLYILKRSCKNATLPNIILVINH